MVDDKNMRLFKYYISIFCIRHVMASAAPVKCSYAKIEMIEMIKAVKQINSTENQHPKIQAYRNLEPVL